MIKRCLWILLLFAFLACSACSRSVTKSTDAVTLPTSDPDSPAVTEEADTEKASEREEDTVAEKQITTQVEITTEDGSGNAKKIAKGTIYEITPNNFVEGIFHDFEQVELTTWRDALEKVTFVRSETEYNKRYLIHLYDEKGSQLYEFWADDEGIVFLTDDEYHIENELLSQMIRQIVQKES